jgi:Rrf2 family transcriptional regulator, iron-sulfur cluster assembly transcription factor
MIVSTRGRYALRVIIDLAEQNADEFIPLKDISERQGISLKYLETIMTTLSKAGFVDGIRGKSGGYKLNRAPEEYKVRKILELTEGTLAPVACLDCNAPDCERKEDCRTLPLWKGLYSTITDYLDKITVADLMKAKK